MFKIEQVENTSTREKNLDGESQNLGSRFSSDIICITLDKA